MRRLPSVKTLESAFPGKGRELRAVLEMSKAELLQHPAGKERQKGCHNPPACYDIRLHVLNAVAGTYGVEYVHSERDSFTEARGFDYLNTGDTYAPTIVRMCETGNYKVASWGGIVEKGGYQ
jgi:hypothetical protein